MNKRQTRPAARSKAERMTNELREQIITGKLKVGDFLPSELALCDMYNLSNNTVRKGLEVLVSEGFIKKIPRIGAQVIARPENKLLTVKFGHASLLREMHMPSLIEAFHKKHPNIQILPTEIRYPAERDNASIRQLADQVDVMMINPYNFEQLARDMNADSLSDILVPQVAKEGMYPFLTKPFLRGGKLFAQPFVFTPVILCYNKDHFRERNLPEPDSSWTWEDVRKAGLKLSNPDQKRYGLYFHVSHVNRWPLFLLQNGVKFTKNKQGKYHLRDPKIVEGLQCLKSLIDDASLFPSFQSEGQRDEEALFLSQKISMVLSTYDRLYSFRHAPFTYDIAPVPYLRTPKTLLHTVALAISAGSQQKVAAQMFVDFLTSYEAQVEIRKHTLRIPANKLAAEWTGDEPIRNRPSRFYMYRDIIPTFHCYTELNMPIFDLMTMLHELKFYWSGLEDLDTVLERLEHQLGQPHDETRFDVT